MKTLENFIDNFEKGGVDALLQNPDLDALKAEEGSDLPDDIKQSLQAVLGALQNQEIHLTAKQAELQRNMEHADQNARACVAYLHGSKPNHGGKS